MTLPPIPETVFHALGPIPVEAVEDLRDVETGETLFGYWDPYKRVIYLRAGMHPVTAWATLWHERTHAELNDIGVKLRTDQEEAICEAVARARVAELLAST